ncbi:hypothetical protein Ga0100231_009920 [Opitutaceae bacterium TAV4]|nr:hypothetical protein Ga0100231_009920 [Opitutaceae bacterium TAV4]RRJ98683.1 hypothetical protein Ga0100230_010045 [Opitutaceae bacterium TAV3]
MKIKPKNDNAGPLWRGLLALGAGLALLLPAHSHAQLLAPTHPAANDYFGYSVSASGDAALVGMTGQTGNSGNAYYYHGLSNKSGTVTQNLTLTPSDGLPLNDAFGLSVSVYGTVALVGAPNHNSVTGAAYYYGDLSIRYVGNTTVETAKLMSSDGATSDKFGQSVSAWRDLALVGAYRKNSATGAAYSGAAYYYDNLPQIPPPTGIKNKRIETAKFIASDGAANDFFGYSVSLHGGAFVGAVQHATGGYTNAGAVYYYDISAASGTVTQTSKLIASDHATGAYFGSSVSANRSGVIVGSYGKNSNTGAAYYYSRLLLPPINPGIIISPPTLTQTAKLIATDAASGDRFGTSVSLGDGDDSALIGADGKDGFTGAVYYYRDISVAAGKTANIPQDVKFTASDALSSGSTPYFGHSVSLNGDRFTIGSHLADASTTLTHAGKVYAGDIRAFTTLDTGSTTLETHKLSFVSRGDWIIGETTSENTLTLSSANVADVRASGKAVYIGKESTANDNTLILAGRLYGATTINVGAAGNTGNLLQLDNTAANTIPASSTVNLTPGNLIALKGDYTADISGLLTRLRTLKVSDGTGVFTTVTTANYDTLINLSSDGTYTYVHTGVGPVIVPTNPVIAILSPASRANNYLTLPGGSHFTTLTGYLQSVATLTTGALDSYVIGSSDGVIINLTASNGTYTTAEAAKITALLATDTPVLILGGINTFASTLGNQLKTLLGGGTLNTYANATQSVVPTAPAALINGVSSITFSSQAYKLTPAGTGTAVSSDNTLTLWGTNQNILLLLDYTALTDPGTILPNGTLANNIAAWLTVPTNPPVQYTVTFDSDGGSAVPPQTVNHGATATQPANPIKTGYTFAGWYNGATVYDFDTLVTGDLTLTAHWTINQYTVTFDSDAGSAVPPQTVNHGATATRPANPTKDGYTFVDWYNGATVYDFDTPVTGALTLTAHWTINQYTVAFNSEGGSPTPGSQTVNHGATATEPTPAPTKAGYTFAGWYNGVNVYSFSTPVTGTLTLTAHWTLNQYTVTFNSDGGSVVSNQTVNHGALVTQPPDPTKDGYTFAGWYDGVNVYSFNTPVTGALTLTAHWTEVIAAAAPATLSEPVINGNTITIDVLGTPGNYYALHASEELKAPAALWGFVSGTAGQFDGVGLATLTFPKSAATAEFYRVVTSATSLASGAINPDAKFSYNVGGRYDVTIPAGGEKLVAHQLISSKTTVAQLFDALPNHSSVNVQNIEEGTSYGEFYTASSKNAFGAWTNGTRVVQPGYSVVAANGSKTDSAILSFGGIVPNTAQTYTIKQGEMLLMGMHYPMAVVTPEEVGYTRAARDVFNKQIDATANYIAYSVNGMGAWTGGNIPAFSIGEGFYFTGDTNKTWVQPALNISEDSIEIQ